MEKVNNYFLKLLYIYFTFYSYSQQGGDQLQGQHRSIPHGDHSNT